MVTGTSSSVPVSALLLRRGGLFIVEDPGPSGVRWRESVETKISGRTTGLSSCARSPWYRVNDRVGDRFQPGRGSPDPLSGPNLRSATLVLWSHHLWSFVRATSLVVGERPARDGLRNRPGRRVIHGVVVGLGGLPLVVVHPGLPPTGRRPTVALSRISR